MNSAISTELNTSRGDGHAPASRVLASPVADSCQGTNLSNTVPSNCITHGSGQILRCGIDSLYLSFQGDMTDDSFLRLTKTKELAKSDLVETTSLAQIELHKHLFEVAAFGRHPYAFVLRDAWYRLQVSKQGARLTPLAYCKIASEVLTRVAPSEVVADLTGVVSAIGHLNDLPNVSRADLCVDFVTPYPIDQILNDQWVTKARKFAQYTDDRRFSGFAIAAGGILSSRLYNKTIEMKNNPRPYLEALWREQGWDGVSDVWRLEFQFQRQALRDLGVKSFPDLMASLAGLWQYVTHDWLRHTVPNPSDKTQTRWPASDLWELLQSAQWSGINEVHRINSERSCGPSDRTLFVNGLSPLTSFMARENYSDPDFASAAFLELARDFHNRHSDQTGVDFDNYVSTKVRQKRKSYNTARNLPLNGSIHPADKAVADEYRKRSNGDY